MRRLRFEEVRELVLLTHGRWCLSTGSPQPELHAPLTPTSPVSGRNLLDQWKCPEANGSFFSQVGANLYFFSLKLFISKNFRPAKNCKNSAVKTYILQLNLLVVNILPY